MTRIRRDRSREPVVLLAASSGGHLHEMRLLARRIVPRGYRAEWLVPWCPQSDEIGADETVHIVHDTPPRAWWAMVRDIGPCGVAIRAVNPIAVVSTGAGLAVAALGSARALGVEAHYIESAARTLGPSLTGRMVTGLPGVGRYTQWASWSSPRWLRTGSVFDGFVAEPEHGVGRIERVVVTLGTQPTFEFRRLVVRLLEILPPSAQVLWQTGCTDVAGLGIEATPNLAPAALRRAMEQADVVVAHAGIGSAVGVLQAGRLPVLVPRRREFGEHIDDHQATIGRALGALGLAVVREVEGLGLDDLLAATQRRVRDYGGPPLVLKGRLGTLLEEQRRLGSASCTQRARP
ncbi:MAG: glycosyltransferase [Actinomycetota bacterium]|nr:glycosyltransferase [Actinomycetota bacterium]